MSRTICASVNEIVDGHSGEGGPTVEQRLRQCCAAVQALGGLLPSQCTAAHVLASAYRVEQEAAAIALRWQGRGPGPEVEAAEEAMLDAADAVSEAANQFLRICGRLVVEVPANA